MQISYNVGWGFTKACNLKCKHCYNASGTKGDDELNLQEAKAVVDKLIKNGVKTINYGTGECGLVPDFWKIVEYAGERGLVQGLTTNGFSVNKNTIEIIKKYINDIDISLDFPEPNRHNEFRGSNFAWKWAMNAMELLKEYSVPFSFVTCIHQKNSSFQDIDGFINIAQKHDCLWRINWFRPTGRGKNEEDLKLDTLHVHDLFIYICSKCIIKAIPDPYFSALLGINSRQGCPCGKNSFRITPSGKVVPCVYFTKEMDNLSIKDSSFSDILDSKPFLDINAREKNPNSLCRDCDFFENCRGGCASRAYLQNYILNVPDSFCYKQAGMEKNPFAGIQYQYEPDAELKVHENYLCTVILKPKSS